MVAGSRGVVGVAARLRREWRVVMNRRARVSWAVHALAHGRRMSRAVESWARSDLVEGLVRNVVSIPGKVQMLARARATMRVARVVRVALVVRVVEVVRVGERSAREVRAEASLRLQSTTLARRLA